MGSKDPEKIRTLIEDTAEKETSSPELTLEIAKTHPNRALWHMPRCDSFKENPDSCYYRTIEAGETGIKFIGQEEILEDVSAVFMTPTYYEEWEQGNIQSQLFELLSRTYSGDDNIEIVYLLNELTSDEIRGDTGEELKSYLSQFPDKPESSYIYGDTRDYSSMTEEQFKEYRKIRLSQKISYPAYLYENRDKSKAEKIEEVNNEIISFFSDISRAQSLGRINTSHNPGLYSEVQNRLMTLYEKYQNSVELGEIIKLSFVQAKNVDISMLNLLNTDFLSEGYQEKGIASIRTIGMDYARIRYKDNSNIIAQPLDGDSFPSAEYVKELTEFYRQNTLECTQVPFTTMILPGLDKKLTETGLNAVSINSGCADFPPYNTISQSCKLSLLNEINGVSGEPTGSVYTDEDYYLARRMDNLARCCGGDKYRVCQELPPIAMCVVDRPGWVDGFNRRSDILLSSERPGIKHYIVDETFVDPDLYGKFVDDHLNGAKNITTLEPPSFEFINKKYLEYCKSYYENIYLPQNLRNRELFSILSNLHKNGNIVRNEVGNLSISDWDNVPNENKFDVAHFIKHHSALIKSFTQEDWKYIDYLLTGTRENIGNGGGIEIDRLSQFQQSLRGYIGIAMPPEELHELVLENRQSDTVGGADRISFIFAEMASKMAHDLCTQNFFRVKVDPRREESSSANPAPGCYDSFENRSKGLEWLIAIRE